MNYDLNTEEGMQNSVDWMQEMLDRSASPTLVWVIPRSGATYTIHKPSKTYSSGLYVDEPVDRVLEHMGFKKAKLQ